jgi:hypothetical protein
MAKQKRAKARGTTSLPRQAIEIDFVILGDYAQAVGGKLNLIGGGWDVHKATQYPSVVQFGIGIGILVPWALTNRSCTFELVIKASEGTDLLKADGGFEVGRKAGIPPGMTQRVTLGISGQFQLNSPGTYEIIVTSGQASKRISFEALPVGGRR